MARKPYRVEINYSKNKQKKYFLVKDIFYNNKKSKVRKYLGSGDIPPSYEEIELYRKFAFDLELKAARAIGKLGETKFIFEFLTPEEIGQLEELKYLYKRFYQLLSENEVKVYEQNFELRYVGGTTKIEGNTLSLAEVKDILMEGILPQHKSHREINEIQNFINVKKYRDSHKKKVDLTFIKEIHALIMHNIDNENAGIFRRTDDFGIVGCDLALCPAIEIESGLEEILNYYYTRINTGYHPFEEAIMFHYFFEIIHPFSDGNGRVGRELLNYLLMRSKYPKLLFLGEGREEYLNALRLGNDENFKEMVSRFFDIIMRQRMDIITKNIEKMLQTLPDIDDARKRKSTQLSLSDFFTS